LGAVDLHVHTSMSDGTWTPAEAVQEAARRGVRYLAITDHDVTDGVGAAMETAAGLGVEIIPGVEINTDYLDGEVHILGYLMDLTDPGLQSALAQLRNAREDRNRKILARLAELGCPIDPARVAAFAGEGSVGRPHIAAALTEAGAAESVPHAFRRWIGRGQPAFVERHRMTPQEAIAIILAAGGVPVLAHPAGIPDAQVIPTLVGCGLRGVEAYYKDQAQAVTQHYLAIAAQLGLLVTGGTDAHGMPAERGVAIGATPVPETVIPSLRAAARPRS
jgi:predicted metal-dependent phosphoesterase TrpH